MIVKIQSVFRGYLSRKRVAEIKKTKYTPGLAGMVFTKNTPTDYNN
jgi:hypothetical protein